MEVSRFIPFYFVGYWGDCQSLEQQHSLSKRLHCLSNESETVKSIRSHGGEESLVWEVVSSESNFSQSQGVIAGLSAGGLSSPDAWVKVQGQSLILAREGFGRVPLYQMQQGNVLWFASRLSLLLPLLATKEVNIAGFYGYCCFSYVPTPLTPVKNIFVVPAGVRQIWSYDEGKLEYSEKPLQEWQSQPHVIKDEREAIPQLQSLLKDALQQQLEKLQNETVGVFLSGGLDSSLVAALLVQAGIKVKAYSLDFGAGSIPEYPYAEKVADYLSIPLVKVNATPKRIQKALRDTGKALDLPFGDGVTVPLYILCEAASQEVRVIFNGEGGDQLFAGWTNKPIIAASVYGGGSQEETFIQQYLRTFHRLYGYEKEVFIPEVYEDVRRINPQDWLESALDARYTSQLMDRFRRATLMLKGAQNIHPRATHLAFSHGLRARSLFCDLSLAEWTFRLAGELCLQGSTEKYILKRAVESWLPPEIVWREKRGMGVPVTYWCFNDLWSEVGRWLNTGRLQQEGRFVSNIALKTLQGQLGGQIRSRRIGEVLWLLMMWEVWRVSVLGETATGYSWKHPFWIPAKFWRQFYP